MTIKQYTALLKAFFKNHGQVNTVKTGNKFNFNAESKILYPVVNIEYIGERVSGSSKLINYFITIGDIFDPNLDELEGEIYSETASIAEDLFNYFTANFTPDYSTQESGTLSPFNNGNIDRICGHTFVFTFDEFRTGSDCDIPFKSKINNL